MSPFSFVQIQPLIANILTRLPRTNQEFSSEYVQKEMLLRTHQAKIRQALLIVFTTTHR